MKMKMAPKRDKLGFKSKEDRSEQTQADHELFLQAFESKNIVDFRISNLIFVFRADTNLSVPKNQKSDLSNISQQKFDLHEEENVED